MLPSIVLVSALALIYIQPLFLTPENILNILRQGAFLLMFALGQMIPTITRGLDLSQGGIVTSVSVTFAILAREYGTAAGACGGLLLGAAAGVINGFLVAILRISPFAATLGVGFALRGLALIASNGQPVSDVPESFTYLGWKTIGAVPMPLIIACATLVVTQVILAKTLGGRYIYAIGSSERAAALAGMPVKVVLLFAYTACGVLTAAGSLLVSSRISSGHPTAGSDTALQAIAAVVIGGVSLLGGKGSALGVAVGALYLAFLSNALNLLQISSYVQQVVIGCAIVIAVIIDRLRTGH
jgi:ribose/xylose/arabinose/galactoside ABC-type transport system permease subunit